MYVILVEHDEVPSGGRVQAFAMAGPFADKATALAVIRKFLFFLLLADAPDALMRGHIALGGATPGTTFQDSPPRYNGVLNQLDPELRLPEYPGAARTFEELGIFQAEMIKMLLDLPDDHPLLVEAMSPAERLHALVGSTGDDRHIH